MNKSVKHLFLDIEGLEEYFTFIEAFLNIDFYSVNSFNLSEILKRVIHISKECFKSNCF